MNGYMVVTEDASRNEVERKFFLTMKEARAFAASQRLKAMIFRVEWVETLTNGEKP